jgi:ferritin
MSETIITELQAQVNYELESEFIYLAISTYYSYNFSGMCNFFIIQAHEERVHAMKFYKFLAKNKINPVLKDINLPKKEILNPIEGFQMGLEHEKFITDRINLLSNLAKNENNSELIAFLDWFIEEQEEEEESFEKILERFENSEDKMIIDEELGKRVLEYNPKYS